MKTLSPLYNPERSPAWFTQPACLIFVFLFLHACTATPTIETGPEYEQAYQLRASRISAISEWGFVGKISLDDGDQGGSGRLQWEAGPEQSELDFHAAMGRGAWHLLIGPEAVVLKEADGTEQTAPGVDALIQDRMGWPIPVDALQWWVRGLAAPGDIESREFDARGLMVNIHQFGWEVDFHRYDSANGIELPKRLNARRDKYRVKLAVSRWRMDGGHVSEN